MVTNDQLIASLKAGQDDGAVKEQLKQKNAISEILKIAQDPNLTPETDLEGFQNQGGYAPEEESRTPGSLTPRQQGSNVKKGDKAQRKAEESRGGEQLKPEEIWPNYPKMNIKPQDLLKILQLIPAAAGFNLQMANAGDQMIQGLPRGGRYGNSHRPARESGELTDEKLIDTLRIAGPLLKGA